MVRRWSSRRRAGPERSRIATPATSARRSAKGQTGLSAPGTFVPVAAAKRSKPGTIIIKESFGFAGDNVVVVRAGAILLRRECENPRAPYLQYDLKSC